MEISGGESRSSPTTAWIDVRSHQYLLLVFSLSFLYAAALPTINLLATFYFNPGRSAFYVGVLSNPNTSVPLSFGRALLFILIFYQIGKKVNFQKDYVMLALLSYTGVLAFYSLSFPSLIGQINSEQQIVGYFLSALASFGILFGALSLTFVRVQLPHLEMPPVKLTTYRRPYIIGVESFLTNFASPVLSGFIAALLLQRGSSGQDPLYFVRYYFSGTDPLYVNYIVYPLMFVLLVYYFGMKTDFNHVIVRILLYLFLGGLIGLLSGFPLGSYLRIFFNPPSPSSSIHTPELAALLPDAVYQAIEVTLLGLSTLTIALLRRRSDLVADEDKKN